MVNHPDSDGDDLYEQLQAHAASHPRKRQQQNTLFDPLPSDYLDNGVFPETGDDVLDLTEKIVDWLDENKGSTGESRKRAWWISPVPMLIVGIRHIMQTMPPKLPKDSDLTTYQGINELASREPKVITILQEDPLILMRTLMVLQLRDIHPSELERAILRMAHIVKRLPRERELWEKQMQLHAANEKQSASGSKNGRFGWAHPKWESLALEMFRQGRTQQDTFKEIQNRHRTDDPNYFGNPPRGQCSPGATPSKSTVCEFLKHLQESEGISPASNRGRPPKKINPQKNR